MAADDERLDDQELEGSASEEEEDEFADDENIEATAELDDIDADAVESGSLDGEENEEAIDAVVELTSKEQSARSLEIRRAIEKQMEERHLHEDIDYLDYDLDD